MRVRLAGLLVIFAAVTASSGVAARDATVRVIVNDRVTRLDPPAVIRDGKAYVGLRCVATVLGACTSWDSRSKTVVVTAGNKRARVRQSQGIMVDGTLFLPLRATGEAVGCTVEWDSGERAVRITAEAPAPTGGG